MNNTGNKNTTSDFLRVLMALKENIFFDLNVADVCEVQGITQDFITCKSITTGGILSAAYLQGMDIFKGDIVLVIFCNYDFRAKLLNIKRNKAYSYDTPEELHSSAYGVIVGVIYSKETP